jgi:ParB family transcriptional regulator, chromosome partitioning protein
MADINTDLSNKKQRLGRGLGSLLGGASSFDVSLPESGKSIDIKESVGVQASRLPTAESTVPAESRVWQVAIDRLQPSGFQPRTHFEKGALEELANSIRQNGILQPIVARRIDNKKIEIIAGERRWRAAQIAGLHEVPVILKTMKNQQALELAIIENIQREDLNPIEEAEAYLRLVDEFQLTQQQVAEKVGRERATVSNTMRLLNLPSSVQAMLSHGEISSGHAKVLLGTPDATNQEALAKRVRDQKLSVRQLEKLVQTKPKPAASGQPLDTSVTQRLISGLAEELQKILGTKVNIDYLNSKGKISVHFYSDEELTQIIERLKAGCQK